MRYICDAPGNKTWFCIETEGEAADESDTMQHAVEKYFRKEKRARDPDLPADLDRLHRTGDRPQGASPARDAAVPDAARRRRDPLVTAMLPAARRDESGLPADSSSARANTDPYTDNADAIRVLAQHFRIVLDPVRAASPTAATSRSPHPAC